MPTLDVDRPIVELSVVSEAGLACCEISVSFQQLPHRKDVQPGVGATLQTFGSFASNFNPHCHGLVTEGVFTPQGEFLPSHTPRPIDSQTSKCASGSYC